MSQEEDKQERDDATFDLIQDAVIDCIDFSRIIQEFERRYQQGYSAGYEAARAEMLAELESVVAAKIKALKPASVPAFLPKPERSEADQPTDLKAEPDAPRCTCEAGRIEGLSHHTECPLWAPLVPKAVAEAREAPDEGEVPEEPEKRTGEPLIARKRAPRAEVRGPMVLRPAGIPTTFEMVAIVLDREPDLTSQDVVDRIRDRWWPGLDFKRVGPEISTWIRKGRILRDEDGKLQISEGGRKLAGDALRFAVRQAAVAPIPDAELARLPKEVVSELSADAQKRHIQVSAPRAAPPKSAPARPSGRSLPHAEIRFEHGDRFVMLSTSREYVLAGKLKAAMGKGHVSEAFLASAVLGHNTEGNRDAIKMAALQLNGPLAEVGLKVEYYAGFGLIMKDLP